MTDNESYIDFLEAWCAMRGKLDAVKFAGLPQDNIDYVSTVRLLVIQADNFNELLWLRKEKRERIAKQVSQ